VVLSVFVGVTLAFAVINITAITISSVLLSFIPLAVTPVVILT